MGADENKRQMEGAFPSMPDNFDFAVRKALEEVHGMQKKHVRRTALLTAALILALVGGALAVGQSIGVFNFFENTLPEPYQKVSEGAYDLVAAPAAAHDFEHVTVSVKEAVYDGQMLRIVVSVRDRAATEPLNIPQEELWEYSFDAAQQDHISWQIMDWITVNGEDICPEGDVGIRCGTENGEVLQYIQTYLDSADADTLTISLPIVMGGTTPDDLTFTLPARDIKGVTAWSLPEPQDMGDYTAKVIKAVATPLRVYVDVRFDGEAQNLQDKLMSTWFDAQLVDAQGKVLTPALDSSTGVPGGDTETYGICAFLGRFAPLDEYPDTVYLAPRNENGEADMDRAIAIRTK